MRNDGIGEYDSLDLSCPKCKGTSEKPGALGGTVGGIEFQSSGCASEWCWGEPGGGQIVDDADEKLQNVRVSSR